MTLLKAITLATLTLACAGWAQGAPVIPDRFELKPLHDPAAAQEMAQCLGAQVSSAEIEKFVDKHRAPEAVNSQGQLATERGPAAVIVARASWACVRMSADGFPLWPVESLAGMIVPVGVPADEVAQWRRSLLEQVAEQGVARGLIVYPGGTATQVNLIGDPRQAMLVKFTTRFLKAGEFKAEEFKPVLAHPGLTSLVTQSTGSGAPSRFAIPPQRLRKALDGEYVALPASDKTGGYAFTNTRWKFPQSGSELWLQPEGLVILSSKQSSDNGSWKVEQGVLRVALSGGARYAMTLQADEKTMAGEGRRSNKPSHAEDDGEWQWSFSLQRL